MGSLVRSVVRALLYVRVSTDEQARSGFSLGQQLEALRSYCQDHGIEVMGEFEDRSSGASLDRAGLDTLRDVVAGGGIDLALCQDRDRISREPAHVFILREELRAHGTTLRALNDRGDDSPEGQLTDGIFDQLAKYERAKTLERTRRSKLQKARSGKIVGNGTAPMVSTTKTITFTSIPIACPTSTISSRGSPRGTPYTPPSSILPA
jgi:site-specific DNA recombinase